MQRLQASRMDIRIWRTVSRLRQKSPDRETLQSVRGEGMSELERLVCLLEDWAKWQSSYRPKTGFKSRSAGFIGLSGVSSFEDMCEQSDNATMKTIDASIDSLLPAQAAAIHRAYGVCAVFRFQRENFAATLEQAHDCLVVIVKRKGVVL